MNDVSQTVIPKSDQMNADDLISGPVQITVSEVRAMGGDQPLNIHYANDNGRPYKPCKSMRRAMIHLWGSDADQWIGRSMVLFCDPTVKWAGKEIGGIRISHMSHIEKDMTLPLTVTRGKRAPFKIKVLQVFAGNPLPPEILEGWRMEIEAAQDMDALSVTLGKIKSNNYDEAGMAALRQHKEAAVNRIRGME
jgi:hypothetical protein